METEYKLYKRRWFIMVIFMMYAINGAAQWLQFAIITDLVLKYYNGITPMDVEWTTMISMLACVIFIIPSLFLLDKVGVRNMMKIGAIGIAIGTWIKVFSVHRDRFFMVLLGQSLQAVFLVLTFGLSARFTAIWFGADEISIAGALGLFGDQLGTALTFFIPPTLVKDGPPEVIGDGLQKMQWYNAGISMSILLLIILFFKSEPKTPPSAAQAKQGESQRESVYQALKTIMMKRSFILIFLSYGLNLGSFGAMAALLNQTVLMNFSGCTEDAGRIGLVIMLSGMFSSLVIGKILDKTRKFKESAVLLTTGSTLAFIAFTWALKSDNIFFVYIVAFFIGSFAQGYYGTGFQMAIEVTFPVSEEISSAMLFFSVQSHSFIITLLYGYAIKKYGDLVSNIALAVLFSISVLYAFLIPPDLKRQDVEKSARDKLNENEFTTDLLTSERAIV